MNRIRGIAVIACAMALGMTGASRAAELPEGYRAVEYVAANGTQYVDVGLPLTNTYSVEIGFMLTGSLKGQYIFGARTGASERNFQAFTGSNSELDVDFNSSSYETTRLDYEAMAANTRYWLRSGRDLRELRADGPEGDVLKSDDTPIVDEFSTPKNCLLFSCDCTLKYSKMTGRIYSFRITDLDADKAIRDLVPCVRLSDGAVGFYDVSDHSNDAAYVPFYTNKGTGAFRAPGLVGCSLACEWSEAAGQMTDENGFLPVEADRAGYAAGDTVEFRAPSAALSVTGGGAVSFTCATEIPELALTADTTLLFDQVGPDQPPLTLGRMTLPTAGRAKIRVTNRMLSGTVTLATGITSEQLAAMTVEIPPCATLRVDDGHLLFSIEGVDLTQPATAVWTDGGRRGDASDPENWLCRDANGAILPGALPTFATVVRIDGDCSFSTASGGPAGSRTIEGKLTLSADCAWDAAAFDAVTPGTLVDLNGHVLSLAGFDGRFGRGLMLADFAGTGELRVDVAAGMTFVLEETLLRGRLKLVKSGEGDLALVCADGDTRLGTSAFIAEFLANVGTTWFACRSLGAVGCALGPLCGQLASLAVLLPHFLSDRNSLRFRPYFSLRDSGRVFLTEFPASAAVLFTSLVYVFMNRTLVAQDGDSALVVLAAVSVSNNLMLFLFGVPNAAQPIIGVFRGEGNVRGISTVMCDAVRVSALLGGALSAVLSLWPDFPARIIGIDDPDILVRATEAVRIMAPSYLFFGIGTLFFTYYLFVERRMAAMTLTTLQEFAFPLAGCLCGRVLGGAVGFWCGYALAPVLALSVFFGVLRLRRRGAFDPFMLPPADDRVFEWNVFVSEKTACEVASAVHGRLDQSGVPMKTAVRADMLVEDMLMTVRERNAGRKVRAAVMLDQRSGVRLVFHDDGVAASSFVDSGDRGWFRAQTLGAVIGTAAGRNSAVTCGFNRNEYSFDCR